MIKYLTETLKKANFFQTNDLHNKAGYSWYPRNSETKDRLKRCNKGGRAITAVKVAPNFLEDVATEIKVEEAPLGLAFFLK